MKTKSLFSNLTLWLGTLILSFPLGAAFFGMMVIVPLWTKNLPEGLMQFDRTNIDMAAFWMGPVLNVGVLTLIVSLILTWKTARRNWILAYLIIYIFTLVVTYAYFLPKLAIMGVFPLEVKTSEDIVILTKAVNDWVFADKIRFYAVMVPSFLLLFKAISIPVDERK
jgi:hypothetical protein